MTYKCYTKVKIVTDKYEKDGVPNGTIGVILDIYDIGDYEVQFLDNNGEPSNIFFAVEEADIIQEYNQ